MSRPQRPHRDCVWTLLILRLVFDAIRGTRLGMLHRRHSELRDARGRVSGWARAHAFVTLPGRSPSKPPGDPFGILIRGFGVSDKSLDCPANCAGQPYGSAIALRPPTAYGLN